MYIKANTLRDKNISTNNLNTIKFNIEQNNLVLRTTAESLTTAQPTYFIS